MQGTGAGGQGPGILIYLGLGSNLGDLQANLRAAIAKLGADDLRVLRVSPVYETAPVDLTDQPWFLNLVVEAETSLSPSDLLARILSVEAALGRVRDIPKGPRSIDIDILLYGAETVSAARLEIPHPRMAERRFVLAPLADLAPDIIHPVAQRTIRELLQSAPPSEIRSASLKLR
jgi:2-amino-4-hydroxy-6-hydroxymethyldihydropteridine diphosphokinase